MATTFEFFACMEFFIYTRRIFKLSENTCFSFYIFTYTHFTYMYIHLPSNVFPLTISFCCFSVSLFAMRDIFTNKYEYFLYMILGGFLQANGVLLFVY